MRKRGALLSRTGVVECGVQRVLMYVRWALFRRSAPPPSVVNRGGEEQEASQKQERIQKRDTQFSSTSATSGGQRDRHLGHQVRDATLRLTSNAELISAF